MQSKQNRINILVSGRRADRGHAGIWVPAAGLNVFIKYFALGLNAHKKLSGGIKRKQIITCVSYVFSVFNIKNYSILLFFLIMHSRGIESVYEINISYGN